MKEWEETVESPRVSHRPVDLIRRNQKSRMTLSKREGGDWGGGAVGQMLEVGGLLGPPNVKSNCTAFAFIFTFQIDYGTWRSNIGAAL